MKKFFILLIVTLLLTGCTSATVETTNPSITPEISTTTVEAPSFPATEETENAIIQMTVYYPDENAVGFLTKIVEGEQLTFLETMIEAGVLNEAVEINTITREDTHLTIDFNGAFRDLICTMGTSGERMIIGSVVNTLIVNYNVETVSITVDGETWESGHVIYDHPMGIFE